LRSGTVAALAAGVTFLVAWRLSAAAGLYWVASNVIGVVQSLLLRRTAKRALSPNDYVAMKKSRLEAFSDGVIAILITIMVLELRAPHGGEWGALRAVVPSILMYVLSFVILGIYWNNHHHMLQAAARINGATLWANLHLLFWLSLVPFVTSWMGENHFESVPTALYGVVLLCCAIAYTILTQTLLLAQPAGDRRLSAAIGSDVKGKFSLVLYVAAIPLAFVHRAIADALYVAVALIWFIPDRRIESRLQGAGEASDSVPSHSA
jgi:uncharacterized membrane protein